MKKKILFFLTFSLMFSENDISFSLNSSFAKDKNSTFKSPTYFENILDANILFGSNDNNIY